MQIEWWMAAGNLIKCPTVWQKLGTTSLNQHYWQHWRDLEGHIHTIITDRQFSILFLTMSMWFEGVGPMMINIIFHLKLLLTTTIFHCFWETKCLKSDHADSLPYGSWFSPVLLCGYGALAKLWRSPSLLDLSCREEEEPHNVHFSAIYARTTWSYYVSNCHHSKRLSQMLAGRKCPKTLHRIWPLTSAWVCSSEFRPDY